MENKAYIFELQDFHKKWINDLDFYKEQVKVFEERLAKVSLNNVDKDVKIEVEKFQNRFIIQRNEIDYLRHDIKQQENELEREEKTAPIISEMETITEEFTLKDRMDTFERLFLDLQLEFDTFIEKHI
ncbi:hypothetical protein EGI22_12695 [Lacihabitans sp. LS3-19]|uniref:hypothetical protein n=1 Tax=Lacihabitans sp. LS3-19 TaxID=2487335 RepID=UPI0020CCA663|nr:hypothetical protein [Lacihabitans sp. LS3-19]MCP9768777.1 hypothetical protein [Lacihabitans sp. LS3-19]